MPQLYMAFIFMGVQECGNKLAILVVKERMPRMLAATVVRRKTTGEYAAKRVVAFMRETGCDQIRAGIKSDNEPGKVDLVERVSKVRASRGGSADDGRQQRRLHQRQQWRGRAGVLVEIRADASAPCRAITQMGAGVGVMKHVASVGQRIRRGRGLLSYADSSAFECSTRADTYVGSTPFFAQLVRPHGLCLLCRVQPGSSDELGPR